jgi:hypothetical protein
MPHSHTVAYHCTDIRPNRCSYVWPHLRSDVCTQCGAHIRPNQPAHQYTIQPAQCIAHRSTIQPQSKSHS